MSIRIQKVVWLFGAILALFTVSTPTQAAKTPVLRNTIHLWHMAVRVPQDFKDSGGPSNSLGTTTWTITGPSATITLARTLYNPRNAFQILPLQPQEGGVIPRGTSPYVSRYDSGSEVTINIVTRKGTEDSLTVDMQTGSALSSPLAHAIIANWQHPPLLTTTQAVTKLERAHNWYHGINLGLSRGTPNAQWLLVGGPPATAQQSWYLFHTINGGDTWQLQRYTVWQGCQSTTEPRLCNFIRSAGPTTLLFWNAHQGVIAQAGFAYSGVTILRTGNGGQTWTGKNISLSQQPQGVLLRRRRGLLVLTIVFFGHTPHQVWYSANGGASWSRQP